MPENPSGIASDGEAAGKLLFDETEVAFRFAVSPRLVRELWNRRELTGVKVGRFVRFSEADLVEYIERHRVRAVR